MQRFKTRKNFWDLKQFMHKAERKRKGKGSYLRSKSKRNLLKDLKNGIKEIRGED